MWGPFSLISFWSHSFFSITKDICFSLSNVSTKTYNQSTKHKSNQILTTNLIQNKKRPKTRKKKKNEVRSQSDPIRFACTWRWNGRGGVEWCARISTNFVLSVTLSRVLLDLHWPLQRQFFSISLSEFCPSRSLSSSLSDG